MQTIKKQVISLTEFYQLDENCKETDTSVVNVIPNPEEVCNKLNSNTSRRLKDITLRFINHSFLESDPHQKI